MFLFNFLQILAWIGLGYNLKAHNWWGVVAFYFIAMFVGLAGFFTTFNKVMKNESSPNKSF